MQAIATLVENDPYMKLPFRERLHARRERQERIAARAVPDCPVALRVPQFIAPSPEAIREVIAAAKADESWADRQKKIPLPPVAKEAWFSLVAELDPVAPICPTIDQIQRAVCRHTNIPREDLLSQRRTAPVVYARQIGFYLCKTLTFRSLPEIGRRFAGRDHTTILHGVRKIERLIPKMPELAADIEAIRAKITEARP